jgi:hypothetical protein
MEAALGVLRKASSREARLRAAEMLEKAARQLRESLKGATEERKADKERPRRE